MPNRYSNECGKRAKVTASHRNTWFQCRFDFGRQWSLNVGPTQSVLRIFARNFVQTCLGVVPGSGSLKKNGKIKGFLPTETIIFEGLWLVRTHFRCYSYRQSLVLNKKAGHLCHPLPLLFMAVSMIPNTWHSSCYCMRHSFVVHEIGVICLNQLVGGTRRVVV